MSPLETARTALRDAESKLDALVGERDRYTAQLAEAETREAELRQRRVPLPELAEAMRLREAASAYVGDTERDAAQLREQLPDLEARVAYEEHLHDLAATADAATERAAELDAGLRELADLIRPHLPKLKVINDGLEEARAAYHAVGRLAVPGYAPNSYEPAWDRNVEARQKLEHETRKRGHSLKAILGPVKPPSGDLALAEAHRLFQGVAFRHQQARQAAEEAAQAEKRRERQRLIDERERASEESIVRQRSPLSP